MSNVLVEKNKLDILANAISAKSGEPLTLTLDEMVEAVDGIEQNTGITPTGNIDITHAGATDVTNYATATVPQTSAKSANLSAEDGGFITSNGRWWRVRGKQIIENAGWISDGTHYGLYQYYSAVPSGTTITPTESSQTIGGANYMMEGAVTVGAISSTYVGSDITRCDYNDVSSSDDTIIVESGYYQNGAVVGLANIMDYATPSASIAFNSLTGLITASATVTGSDSNTDYAYIDKRETDSDTLQLTTRTSSDLTVSGATVTAPAGYYSAQASKAVQKAYKRYNRRCGC